MSTFRTCWRVLFAQRTMILVYIVYLSLMMFGPPRYVRQSRRSL